MKLVIDLLKQKHNYLMQFKKIGSLECDRLHSGDYSQIERFYYNRQIILDAIENIDKNLKNYMVQNTSEEDKETISILLKKQREITMAILQKDIVIHSHLNDLQYDLVESQIA